jgi:phage gpG-like protein
MAGAKLEVTIEADEALGALGQAVGRLDDPAPLWDAVGAMLVTSTGDRFERETDPEGNPWPPSIRALADGGKTLTDTMVLRNSMTHNVLGAGVEVGSAEIYAAIHQEGGVIRPVNGEALVFSIGAATVFAWQVTIPRRAFLGLPGDDQESILALAGAWVLEGALDAGR